jgi:hypothetical protein
LCDVVVSVAEVVGWCLCVWLVVFVMLWPWNWMSCHENDLRLSKFIMNWKTLFLVVSVSNPNEHNFK